MTFNLTCKLENPYRPSKAKSIDFTKDDRYMAIVFASNVNEKQSIPNGLIAIYPFDPIRGVIATKPTCIFRDDAFKGGEDIRFYKDDSCLLISDHVNDRIVAYRFDQIKGTIGQKIAEIGNPDAKLSFPHGIGLSSNGKFLGVANYGNDNFSIYTVRDSRIGF